jgi:hypothetical protein
MNRLPTKNPKHTIAWSAVIAVLDAILFYTPAHEKITVLESAIRYYKFGDGKDGQSG